MINHAAAIERALIEYGIPPQDASVAAWAMAAKQLPHLPASRALNDLIQAFVELYKATNGDMEECMAVLRGKETSE